MSSMFAAALLLGGQALAQSPSPPAGGTPERMPFFIPYGPSITADRAVKIVAVVLAEASKHSTWRFAISVVGPSRDLVYFYKMDDTQFASIAISQGKARTPARFRLETRAFYNSYETGHSYVSTLDPGLVASPGGSPLVENGKLVGALGCSGGTGDQDAFVCGVGAASFNH